MIDLQYIRNFYPESYPHNSRFDRLMLKEYLQLIVLEHLTKSEYSSELAFIGGTCLRHVYGIDRFSENLDFDCKNLSLNDFKTMTDGVIACLRRNGIRAEARDNDNSHLKAYRRNIFFPELLFDLNLSGYRDERLLLKVEAQDQGIDYDKYIVTLNKLGFTFMLPCAPVDIICAMKIAAVLNRSKGRDFYDLMFLSSLTSPNMKFIKAKCNINSVDELKSALSEVLRNTDLKMKCKDFTHLVIDERQADKILLFGDIIDKLCIQQAN